MSSFRVAITTSSFGESDAAPLTLLRESELDIVFNPHGRRLNPPEVLQIAKDAVGIIAGTEKLDGTVLKQLPKLKVLSRCGSGLDNIDLEASRVLGIQVYNTPEAPVFAVAELTVGMMINLLRHVGWSDQELHRGNWRKQMGHLLSGKRVGIVGLGRIGLRVAELLIPFGAKIAYSETDDKIKHPSIPKKPLSDLLSWIDILTLHCSSPMGGGPLIGKKEIERMKKGSWLINTARGNLVDEDVLCTALGNGHLSGAALDVFSEEPYRGKLTALPNVILTPHIGSFAKESRTQMELEAAKNLVEGLQNLDAKNSKK